MCGSRDFLTRVSRRTNPPTLSSSTCIYARAPHTRTRSVSMHAHRGQDPNLLPNPNDNYVFWRGACLGSALTRPITYAVGYRAASSTPGLIPNHPLCALLSSSEGARDFEKESKIFVIYLILARR